MISVSFKRIAAVLVCGFMILSSMPVMAADAVSVKPQTAYDFSFKDAQGKAFPLEQFKGKVVLVVNTATECGLAGQFAGLQKVYDTYKDKGLVIVGVPSNDFGEQEPRTPAEIVKHTKETFGVTFPFVSVEKVSGDDAAPFYKWAADQNKGGLLSSKPRWNFHKYIIGRTGLVADSFGSATQPDSGEVIKAIETALGVAAPAN